MSLEQNVFMISSQSVRKVNISLSVMFFVNRIASLVMCPRSINLVPFKFFLSNTSILVNILLSNASDVINQLIIDFKIIDRSVKR